MSTYWLWLNLGTQRNHQCIPGSIIIVEYNQVLGVIPEDQTKAGNPIEHLNNNIFDWNQHSNKKKDCTLGYAVRLTFTWNTRILLNPNWIKWSFWAHWWKLLWIDCISDDDELCIWLCEAVKMFLRFCLCVNQREGESCENVCNGGLQMRVWEDVHKSLW